MPRLLLFCMLLGASLAASLLLCHFDNKYTLPGPRARDGVLLLEADDRRRYPLLFLASGWEFYRGYHTPRELAGMEPERIVYPGQYGGFALDDPDAPARGCATYRLVVETPEEALDWMLELPEVYSSCRLWVNGEERRAVGEPRPGDYRPATGVTAVEIRAGGRIELVLAASNFTSVYSGMVHPPAFGTPAAVGRLLAFRLASHSVLCAAALLAGAGGLVMGVRRGQGARSALFLALCLFYIGYAGYPIVHTFGLSWGGWYTLEKLSLYGMLYTLTMLAGRLSGAGLRLRTAAFSLGAAVCALVVCFPRLPFAGEAGALRFYSAVLHAYQWIAALLLVGLGVLAVRRGRSGSHALLFATGVFGCTLLARSAMPLYEPARFGWPAEWGGLALVLVMAGTWLGESVRAWREGLAAGAALKVQKEQAELLARHIEAAAFRAHEAQKNYALLKFYLEQGEEGRLGRLLERLCGEAADPGLRVYTQHRLLNAILTVKLDKARRQGAEVRQEVACVPLELPYDDADLNSLLSNLLDNAVEGCARLPGDAEKRIWVGIQCVNGSFSVIVRNTAGARPSVRTCKADALFHGHGMSAVAKIVEKYGGVRDAWWEDGLYTHRVALPLREEAGWDADSSGPDLPGRRAR